MTAATADETGDTKLICDPCTCRNLPEVPA